MRGQKIQVLPWGSQVEQVSRTRWAGLLVGVRWRVSCLLGKEQDRRRAEPASHDSGVAAAAQRWQSSPEGSWSKRPWEESGGPAGMSGAGPSPPTEEWRPGVCEPTVLPWDGPGAALTVGPADSLTRRLAARPTTRGCARRWR